MTNGTGAGGGAGPGAGPGAVAGAGGAQLQIVVHQPPPPPPAYVPAFHTAGQLPAPEGNIAKTIDSSRATKEEQRQAASDLNDFLKDPASNLRGLNGEPRIFMAMIMVPGKPELKILYGFELGTVARIGGISPIKDKILALSGDGGPTIGFPQVLVLDPNVQAPIQVKNLTDDKPNSRRQLSK